MGWASKHIEKLKAGETVSFRPQGSSMTGRIESGQLCRVVPVTPVHLYIDDIVLCKVDGVEYLHLIKKIDVTDPKGYRYLIGNKRGNMNGWISSDQVFGKCVAIED